MFIIVSTTKSNRHGDHGTLVGYTLEYEFIDEEGVVYHDDAYNISLENDPELYLGTKYKIYLLLLLTFQ